MKPFEFPSVVAYFPRPMNSSRLQGKVACDQISTFKPTSRGVHEMQHESVNARKVATILVMFLFGAY